MMPFYLINVKTKHNEMILYNLIIICAFTLQIISIYTLSNLPLKLLHYIILHASPYSKLPFHLGD